jgi:hypothetical protein
MEQPPPFELRMVCNQQDMLAAVFASLVSSGWASFHSTLWLAVLAADRSKVTDEAVLGWAHSCFEVVLGLLPSDSPFRAELVRYVAEVMPAQARVMAARILDAKG